MNKVIEPMVYKISTKLKNREWPSHKKRIKLLRTLKSYFSKLISHPEEDIRIDMKINNLFHSLRVPTRKFLNTLLFTIVPDEKIRRIVLLQNDQADTR